MAARPNRLMNENEEVFRFLVGKTRRPVTSTRLEYPGGDSVPDQVTVSPAILVKFVLWILVIVGTTILLRRRKVTSGVRF